MTPSSVRSKVLQTLLRIWGGDTTGPRARRDSDSDEFACAKPRPLYSRNGIRVSVSSRRTRDRE